MFKGDEVGMVQKAYQIVQKYDHRFWGRQGNPQKIKEKKFQV
ncbi:MAG: hypothetical protein ACTSRP_25625 [Candidatus Helarchaeota archaeon]